MADPFERLRQSLFLGNAPSYQATAWQPRCDVYRSRRGWLLKFELAGVRPEDIELSVVGRRLLLRGVRRDWNVEEGGDWYSMEISYNRFERAVDLPDDVEHTDISSEFRDGMLLVCLKTEGAS
ncbi:MAG TPA: Hsp20/alpha crystallin family protein [Pirellulales bacterium]|jgi:HSP20 family protein